MNQETLDKMSKPVLIIALIAAIVITLSILAAYTLSVLIVFTERFQAFESPVALFGIGLMFGELVGSLWQDKKENKWIACIYIWAMAISYYFGYIRFAVFVFAVLMTLSWLAAITKYIKGKQDDKKKRFKGLVMGIEQEEFARKIADEFADEFMKRCRDQESHMWEPQDEGTD